MPSAAITASPTSTLVRMPEEIQRQILRYLLVCEDPIELDPFNPAVPGIIPAGDLSIARASKHFSHLALVVFYGENCFSLPSSRDPFPPTPDARWMKLYEYHKHFLNEPDTPLGCLDLIQQGSVAVGYLGRLQVHLGQTEITCFYDEGFMHRLRGTPSLHTLEFVFDPGWEEILEEDFGEGFMEENEKEILYPMFVDKFMDIVEREFELMTRVLVREAVPRRPHNAPVDYEYGREIPELADRLVLRNCSTPRTPMSAFPD